MRLLGVDAVTGQGILSFRLFAPKGAKIHLPPQREARALPRRAQICSSAAVSQSKPVRKRSFAAKIPHKKAVFSHNGG